MTFVALVVYSLGGLGVLIGELHPRQLLASAAVLVWAGRLGWFLFGRFLDRGRDFRHDQIKRHAAFNLFAWSAQALWIYLVALPLLVLNLSASGRRTRVGDTGGSAGTEPVGGAAGGLGWEQPDLGIVDMIGLAVWVCGMAIEIAADRQKAAWQQRDPGMERWLDRGLWGWCRHPNHFAELVIWSGVFLMCCAAYEIGPGPGHQYGTDIVSGIFSMFGKIGWHWLGAISPPWSAVFLIFTSTDILDKVADKRYGHHAGYQEFKRRVPLFFPRPRNVLTWLVDSDDDDDDANGKGKGCSSSSSSSRTTDRGSAAESFTPRDWAVFFCADIGCIWPFLIGVILEPDASLYIVLWFAFFALCPLVQPRFPATVVIGASFAVAFGIPHLCFQTAAIKFLYGMAGLIRALRVCELVRDEERFRRRKQI